MGKCKCLGGDDCKNPTRHAPYEITLGGRGIIGKGCQTGQGKAPSYKCGACLGTKQGRPFRFSARDDVSSRLMSTKELVSGRAQDYTEHVCSGTAQQNTEHVYSGSAQDNTEHAGSGSAQDNTVHAGTGAAQDNTEHGAGNANAKRSKTEHCWGTASAAEA